MQEETRICQNCRQNFAIEQEDFKFYAKIDVPPPTFCPECRFQRRLMFRNEFTFYQRRCDLCKKDVISSYPQAVPFPVYCLKCWWSDAWDPLSYGREFDFSRPFFEQFKKLLYTVPVLATMNDDGIGSINCQYTYDVAFSKNCYLMVCGWYVENGLYSYNVNHDKEVVDCYHVNNSELIYQSIHLEKCYQCSYCSLSVGCQNCILGYDLRNCSDCFMCIGLRNKSYCIFNKQHSRDEYKRKIEEMHLGNRKNIESYKKEFQEFAIRFPHKYAHIVKSIGSTGNALYNCKMAKNCFFGNDLEDCKFMVVFDHAKDTYDCNNTGRPSLCYESVTPDNSYGNITTVYCWKCNKAEYSNNCHSCNNIFGCTALKTTSYAILNRRYPKEEYIKLREKIIAHMRETKEWGEFFPGYISPFAYNESAAQEWFTLTKEQAIEKGYVWKNPEKKTHQITLLYDHIPTDVKNVDDAIVNDIISCAHQGRCNEKCTIAFRIIPWELTFYRKMNVPLPILCPNCRHYQKIYQRNPINLWHRSCQCAGVTSSNEVYKNTIEH
ncbi:MAG: hypothetical protein HY001_01030, partial [Candidatus Portnoybacteria bacterium]|nr:hypothetical protein [Candidatus Portnoybacteria bacterium]